MLLWHLYQEQIIFTIKVSRKIKKKKRNNRSSSLLEDLVESLYLTSLMLLERGWSKSTGARGEEGKGNAKEDPPAAAGPTHRAQSHLTGCIHSSP